MSYGFTCDGPCKREYDDELPAFMGQVRDQWFKTTVIGGQVADIGYSPEKTITLCGDCLLELLL